MIIRLLFSGSRFSYEGCVSMNEIRNDRMIPSEHVRFCNGRIVSTMSMYLNFMPQTITPEILNEIAATYQISRQRAYAECLAAACEVGSDRCEREFVSEYILPMIHEMDPASFENDPYYQTVLFSEQKNGKWEMKFMEIAPCEAFVCNDFKIYNDGRLIPQIGYFPRAYRYPAILENGREWMTLLPNETITTKPAIDQAFGKVLTYGLGLGYFAFMASSKTEVSSVTVVERSRDVIELFKEWILPYFPHREKINIICEDAFDYAGKTAPNEKYDFIFADIWHDVGDGKDLYLKFKSLEHLSPCSKHAYWLEDTIKCYLKPELWPPRL